MREKIKNIFLDWKELFRPGSFKQFDNLSTVTIDKINKKPVSWEKALFLSELCRLSYIHDVELRKKTFNTMGLKEQCYYSNKGAEFIMLTSNSNDYRINICCFVGTNDIYDYKNLFTYGSTNWDNQGKIYRGFKNSFDNIKEKIVEISSSFENE